MILFSLFNLISHNLASPPQSQASRLQELRDRLKRLRRQLLPTGAELDAAYVGAADDLYELEARIRE
jgi:hypothetical protein